MSSSTITDKEPSISKESQLLSEASASLSPMPEQIRELESLRLEGLASLREWETNRQASAASWAERVAELCVQLRKVMDHGLKETQDACVFLVARIQADLAYAQALEVLNVNARLHWIFAFTQALPEDPNNWNEYSRRSGKLLHDFNEATQTTLIDKGLKEVEVDYKGRMEEILKDLDGAITECASSEEVAARAWKEHERMFMSRFTHAVGTADRWSTELTYRKAVAQAAQKRDMVEARLVSAVAAADRAESWREQNTTSVLRHWLTKQYQLWLHVSSAAQDQQRVLTEELTEAALSATGQVDAVAALRISSVRKNSNSASPRRDDPNLNKSIIATSPEMVCLMRMLGPSPPPRSPGREPKDKGTRQSLFLRRVAGAISAAAASGLRKAGSASRDGVEENDHIESLLVRRPFFHDLREESRKAGNNDASPLTGLVIHSATVPALPSTKKGAGWFGSGPKWTTQRVTVTADAYIYLQDELDHDHDDEGKSISALLTQSTVTLAPEGDAEILSIKPQKQSGMFASAPRSLQLRFPQNGQHLGERWLELLHRVQCQARNRDELLAATVSGKPSELRRETRGQRSSGDGSMNASKQPQQQ
ncbi:hypothetical protein Pmar_PMAR014917 [Perkinsus marinus ATCC 50983]|uniref:PH domain-containing protein n=1 Tax=Perkinsus marinus (strain ATCC 50983 / TXsc) TaxID=423536 RepID=C5L595_PERM5|nr:hypothetical protein Pmar_PMAR014917 [Perkinsus marinus ATCC 50983]EER08154.1 hypothetical protein Pmar_PMAR014917 [Perkinsus marinus ATCC 50983]|eukprot:XP_002776338.1 hypothetical protein Pmar_PMAR014917 [Perkinsus marinus ATCC 50983]